MHKPSKRERRQQEAGQPHELDLGQHFLLLKNDGSMELLTQETTDRTIHGVSLDGEETYRLFMALQAQFRSALTSPGLLTDERLWEGQEAEQP
jgi:hypothetical protein